MEISRGHAVKWKTVNGTPVVIFAYVPDQKRPWLGAYLLQEEDGNQMVPMSWLANGRITNDKKASGEEIWSGLDLQEWSRIQSRLDSPGEGGPSV